jgi:ribonuclease HI
METISIYAEGTAECNPGPATIQVTIKDASGKALYEMSQSIGNATNDFAAYQAVAVGLAAAQELFGDKSMQLRFELCLDNELVKKQLCAESKIDNPGLVPLFIEIHNLRIAHFPNLTLTHVQREFNKEADRLVNEALDAK